MDWNRLKLSDKPLFDRHLKAHPIPLSDYTFTNFWIWDPSRNTHFATFDNWLCVKETLEGITTYMMPIGPPPSQELLSHLTSELVPFTMRAVSAERVQGIAEKLEIETQIVPEEDRFDYLYLYENLKTLSGNDLQPKRNLTHQFENAYGLEYQIINGSNLNLVLQMESEWINSHSLDPKLLIEHQALIRALQNFEILKLEGGCLLVEGKVIAYTLGEKLTPDTLVIHAEKALPGFKGAYQTINQQFLMHHTESLYVNREEALGIPSLEQAKRSYHPVDRLKKFKITQVLCK